MWLPQCYKAVPVLMDRQLHKARGSERVNIMFAVSKVLRLARKELKGKSRLGAWRGQGRGRGALAAPRALWALLPCL
jgi:hypothetical protein